ncbi:MAG: hypothetical protein SGILL_005985 [Bacillariaceae sp.]
MLVELPFSFTRLLERFVPRVLSAGTAEQVMVKEIVSKVLPLDVKQDCDGHSYLVHAMCRHWGLLALSPKKAAIVIDHLSQFFAELRDFLEDSDKPHVITVPTNVETTNDALANDDHGVAEIEAGSEMSKQEQPPSETFPCLSFESCPLYFDTLLKLTIASIAIFSIKDEVSISRSNAWAVHPFSLLENHFELCGALVRLFNDSSGILSGTMSSSMMQSLKMLLDVAAEQIHQCIDWRLTEPQLSPEDIARGKYDPAAISILKDLVESYRIEVVAALEQICIEKSSDKSVAALHRKVEKACEYVSHLSVEFELGEIKTSYSDDSDTDAKPRAKRRRTDSAQPPFDGSTLEDSVTQRQDILGSGDTKPSRKRSNPDRSLDSASSYSEKAESVASQSDSSSSGDFGVSGDWGQNNEPENDDDESSRELGQVTVTH